MAELDRKLMLDSLEQGVLDERIPSARYNGTFAETLSINDLEQNTVYTILEPEMLFSAAMREVSEMSELILDHVHELVQIGQKNDAELRTRYYLKSSLRESGSDPDLRLVYFASEEDYLNDIKSGSWSFYNDKRSPSEDQKGINRVRGYSISALWSLFPSDYMLFGEEKVFSFRHYYVDKKEQIAKERFQYPLWIMDGNLDDVFFVKNKCELDAALQKVTKGKDKEQAIYVIAGRTCIIPTDPERTRVVLYRALLTLLNQPSTVLRQRNWIPFIKYDYQIAFVPNRIEAEYRLKEWMDAHEEDYADWLAFKQENAFDGENGTEVAKKYFNPETLDEMEERFPFLKERSYVTDRPMYIEGWSLDGTGASKKGRQVRQQHIRNLMFAALGLSREDYKYFWRK